LCRLELGIVMAPEVSVGVSFPQLTHLTITKDMFAIDFSLVHDLLDNCVSITVFKVFSLRLANYSEERMLALLRTKPHLRGLRQLIFSFRTCCRQLTAALLHCLLATCPGLEVGGRRRVTVPRQRVENLLSWDLAGLDPALLAGAGRALVMARKSHWR
jgi:hypothetical protein